MPICFSASSMAYKLCHHECVIHSPLPLYTLLKIGFGRCYDTINTMPKSCWCHVTFYRAAMTGFTLIMAASFMPVDADLDTIAFARSAAYP